MPGPGFQTTSAAQIGKAEVLKRRVLGTQHTICKGMARFYAKFGDRTGFVMFCHVSLRMLPRNWWRWDSARTVVQKSVAANSAMLRAPNKLQPVLDTSFIHFDTFPSYFPSYFPSISVPIHVSLVFPVSSRFISTHSMEDIAEEAATQFSSVEARSLAFP